MDGLGEPPAFDAGRVRAALAGTPFVDVRYVAETGSTNEDARALLGRPADAGATLVAEVQSAGRGRRGRAWIAAPRTALTFTTILPRPISASALWAVPFWTALALDDALAATCGLHADLIWPNDLHLGGRKLAGLLAVSRVAGTEAHVGTGVGINLRRPAHEAIAAIDPPPRFLDDVAPSVSREALLIAIVRRFAHTLDSLATPAAVARAWERRARIAGTPYRWRADDGTEGEGVALGLGNDGALVVRTTDGERALDLADVRVVR